MGAFSRNGRTKLVLIEGTLKRDQYKRILEENAIPFAISKHGCLNNFVCQHDNCGPHRAKSIQQYMVQSGINRLLWPAQCPELNPIGNVWGCMKRETAKLPFPPKNEEHLFSKLQSVWKSIPDEYFKKLAESMTYRVAKVIAAKGKIDSLLIASIHKKQLKFSKFVCPSEIQ